MVESAQAPADDVVELVALPEWVVFACQGERFAVPLLSSREVVPPQPITRLPGCGPEVAGLIGLRGRVVTAFDLGVVFGLRSAQETADHRIIVLDHGDRVVAVVVDVVLGVAREQAAMLETVSAELVGMHFEPGDIVGVGKLEGSRYYALDTNRILSRLLA